MIKVYVLNCDIEEIDGIPENALPDEQFKLLGNSYTIKEFQDWLNDPVSSKLDIEISNCWIRFIEEKPKDFIELISPVWNNGFTIHFIKNPSVQEGKGFLHLNPKNMPKS
jgi:hypothetical protein